MILWYNISNFFLTLTLKGIKLLIISGILGVVSSVSASTITIPLNYTTEAEDDQDLTLTGTIVIDTTAAGAADRDQIASQRSNPQALPAWISSLTFTITDSDLSDGDQGSTYSKSDFNFYVWTPKPANVGNVNFSNDLVNQFDDISFFSFASGLTTTSAMQQDDSQNEFNLTSTPSPLLIMGLLPIIYFTRRIKKIQG